MVNLNNLHNPNNIWVGFTKWSRLAMLLSNYHLPLLDKSQNFFLSWTNRKISSSLGQIAEYSTNVCQFGRGGPAQREKVHSWLNRHSLVLSHRKRESQFFKNPRDPHRCFVTYPSWFFESGIKHLPWVPWPQVIRTPLGHTLINAHLPFHLR